MRPKYTILLAFLAFSITACSGSKNSIKKAPFCNPSYEAFSYQPADAIQSTDLAAGEKLNLPEGDYEASTTEIYYTEPNLRIHITATKSADGTKFVHAFNCIGGPWARPNMQAITIAMPFVAKISISKSGKTTIAPGQIFVDLRDRGNSPWIQVDVQTDDKSIDGDFKSVIGSHPINTLKLFEFADGVFDVRQLLTIPGLALSELQQGIPQMWGRTSYKLVETKKPKFFFFKSRQDLPLRASLLS
jgi:hypothetical protein